jgi:hypothetical protein
MIAEQENITKEHTSEGLVFEPGYAGYLRSMGFNVEDITEIDTVSSNSEADKKYLVGKIKTYDKPKDHPDMDLVADEIALPVCTCWNWRSEHSADLDEQAPSESGVCKHLKKAYREVRAENDDNQEELL